MNTDQIILETCIPQHVYDSLAIGVADKVMAYMELPGMLERFAEWRKHQLENGNPYGLSEAAPA